MKNAAKKRRSLRNETLRTRYENFPPTTADSETCPTSAASIRQLHKFQNPWEAGMTIKFADGTRIEVAATSFDDFVRHDLTWAEFVHGSASVKKPARKEGNSSASAADSRNQNVHRCPAGRC